MLISRGTRKSKFRLFWIVQRSVEDRHVKNQTNGPAAKVNHHFFDTAKYHSMQNAHIEMTQIVNLIARLQPFQI